MREILFRGKRTDNGKWVEGELLHDMQDRPYIYWKTPKELPIVFSNHAIVRPETLGQFTGLTDSNGEKVFEGDILCFTDENANYEWIGRVEFGNPNAEYNWGFQLVYINGVKPNTDILLWFDMEETGAYSEVIGNIHDNPDLLEVEDGK